jgi:hypothetical protein
MISIERPRHIRGTTGFMRSRLPQLLVVCRGGAVFSQPGYKRGTARIAAGRLIQGCALRVLGNSIHVGAAREQQLRRALATGARMPERVVDLVCGGAFEQLLHACEDAQASRSW